MISRVPVFLFHGFNPAAAGNLPATGGGVWAAIGGRGTMTRQGAFQSWTDDATVLYTLWVYGRATSLSVGSQPYWYARLYDVTNAQVVIGPTNQGGLNNTGQQNAAYFAGIWKTQAGPLTTLPSNTAGLRIQYTGGGDGAAIYAAALFVERNT